MSTLQRYHELASARDKEIEDVRRQLGKYPDIRLSYWSFTNYRTCPQKWALQFVPKPFPKVKDNFFAISGSVVHSLWESFTDQVKTGRLEWKESDFLTDNVSGFYDRFVEEEPVNWDSHGITPEQHRERSLPEIQSSISWLHQQLTAEGLIPCDPSTVFSEYSFQTPLTDRVTITGRTDFVFVRPTDLIILDLKDVAKRSNVDWRQLVWYTLGIEPQFNKPVSKAGFCLTKLRDWSWRNPNAKDYREKLQKEIFETALSILREPFMAKINRHNCSYCDVASRCPEWQRYSSRSQSILDTIAALDEGPVSI